MIKIIDVDLHRDERGWVMNPVADANIPAEHPGSVHMVSIEPGSVRGNHSHPTSREWSLVCNGPVRVYWQDAGRKKISSMIVAADTPVFMEIDPGCAHAIHNISDSTVYLLAFRDRNPSDTVRVQLTGREPE